jgi:hypothetical protein
MTLPVSPNEGRLAIVTNVRWDAVDADVLLTNGTEVDGEVVWFWRPDAGVKFCGQAREAMVATKPVTKKSTK